MTECFNFSKALEKLNQGGKVTRKNSSNFVFSANQYIVEYFFMRNKKIWVKTFAHPPYEVQEIGLWLTVDDILAEDWYELKNDEKN